MPTPGICFCKGVLAKQVWGQGFGQGEVQLPRGLGLSLGRYLFCFCFVCFGVRRGKEGGGSRVPGARQAHTQGATSTATLMARRMSCSLKASPTSPSHAQTGRINSISAKHQAGTPLSGAVAEVGAEPLFLCCTEALPGLRAWGRPRRRRKNPCLFFPLCVEPRGLQEAQPGSPTACPGRGGCRGQAQPGALLQSRCWR